MQPRSTITQGRILDAAVTALVEHGYAGASTLRIQEIAGVSRGRLLHQFPSRDDLLIAAVQHLASVRVDATAEGVRWPTEPKRRIAAAVDAMWSTYQQDYFWAATELWMGARHNEQLRAVLAAEERRLYQRVRVATDSMFGAPLVEHPEYADVRELVNTSMRGVALTYSFDRRPHARDPHRRLWKKYATSILLAPGDAGADSS
ncbi:MAG: TetR/AcrR family transcriptional regulator [Rhodococcus sp. (in: high G+C Gram-positive bacteria)]|uniref:TetR/AcrR family transcriptional regulator n=1 Tax=Rhodococcus sp. TaxID=1831 RepID=UPI003BAEE54C